MNTDSHCGVCSCEWRHIHLLALCNASTSLPLHLAVGLRLRVNLCSGGVGWQRSEHAHCPLCSALRADESSGGLMQTCKGERVLTLRKKTIKLNTIQKSPSLNVSYPTRAEFPRNTDELMPSKRDSTNSIATKIEYSFLVAQNVL